MTTRVSLPRLATACGLLVVFFLGGCGPLELKNIPLADKLKRSPEPPMGPEELRVQLLDLVQRFSVMLQGTADSISADTKDPEIRRNAVLLKVRVIPSLESAVSHQQALAGFLDLWTLCVQLGNYFREGEGSAMFGPFRDRVADLVIDAEEGIAALGEQFLGDRLEDARRNVHAFAAEHPLKGAYGRKAKLPSHDRKEALKQFGWMSTLSVLQPLSGIDEGAQAIREFNVTALEFAQMGRDLPERTRWQIELLLCDLEARPTVQSALESFTTTSASFERMASTAESLPDQMRETMRSTLEEIESQQSETRETLQEIRSTVDRADEALVNVKDVTTSLEATARNMTAAGEAWEATMRVIDGWVQAARDEDESGQTPSRDPGGETPGGETSGGETSGGETSERDEGGFEILEYQSTAEAITVAGSEVRSLLSEVRDLAGSEEVQVATGEAREVVDHAEKSARSLIDHAAWRLLQLGLAFVVVAFGYRAITTRFLARKS